MEPETREEVWSYMRTCEGGADMYEHSEVCGRSDRAEEQEEDHRRGSCMY